MFQTSEPPVVEAAITLADMMRIAGKADVLAAGRAAEKRLKAYNRGNPSMQNASPELLQELRDARNRERSVRRKMKA